MDVAMPIQKMVLYRCQRNPSSCQEAFRPIEPNHAWLHPPRTPPRSLYVLTALCLLTFGVGCARWSTPPRESNLGGLPGPRLAPGSVVLELTFVRIPKDCHDFAERFWPEIDEAALPAETRRRLAANGFRSGLIGPSLPAVLREIVDQQSPGNLSGGATATPPAGQLVARTRRLHSRPGQKAKIVVRNTPIDNLAALLHNADGRVRGQTFRKAQVLFSIISFDQGGGQVRLELVPMIEHGEPKSGYRGVNGTWTIDNSRRSIQTFDEMKIEAQLSPGEAIAVTCAPTRRGLGGQFFGGDTTQDTQRLLLVVRLQQTQGDNRFSEETTLEPIASTVES